MTRANDWLAHSLRRPSRYSAIYKQETEAHIRTIERNWPMSHVIHGSGRRKEVLPKHSTIGARHCRISVLFVVLASLAFRGGENSVSDYIPIGTGMFNKYDWIVIMIPLIGTDARLSYNRPSSSAMHIYLSIYVLRSLDLYLFLTLWKLEPSSAFCLECMQKITA